MPFYRKKPVVVEARQFVGTGSSAVDLVNWSGGAISGPFDEDRQPYLMVDTLEGVMRADPGDYLVKGVAHEFYPVKPDIFGFTYEPVEVPDEDAKPDEGPCEGGPGYGGVPSV